MNIPVWLKPALYGAVAGAAVIAIAGFSWGGWVTGSTADKLASDRAQREVVAALVPICVEQAKRDPQVAETLAQLAGASSFQRRDLVMKAGWATMPGTSDPNRLVAAACVTQLGAAL